MIFVKIRLKRKKEIIMRNRKLELDEKISIYK